MDHVVAIINPFVMEHTISVYKDGECKKTIKCTMENIEKVCYSLCKEFNIHQLDIHGMTGMVDKLQRELNKNTEFNNFEIIVQQV